MSTEAGANIEVRAARTDEMKDLNRLTGYAFANNELPKEQPDPDPLQPEQTLCAFAGERMVATSGAFDFKMRFNGQTVSADGVTMVSCDPGYRRRGIVRRLIDGLLQRSKERSVPISILWASMGAIYQRFGYGLACSWVTYEIPTRYIEFQFGERPPGYVRLLTPDDALPLLNGLYREYANPATGMLHRGGFYWALMLRRTGDQHTHIAVYYDEADQPRGYCLYRTRSQPQLWPETNQVIDVFDFIWLDIEAYRGLWSYLGGHDLAERVRMDFVAEDDPAPGMLLEPRMLRRRTFDGVWMRIVDVAQALGARGYDLAGEATIEIVDDDLCAWNNGTYRVQASGDTSSVERVAGAISADIVTSPGAFASLVSGYSRPSDLARMGRLGLGDQRRAAELDSLFSSRRRPHCPNMF